MFGSFIIIFIKLGHSGNSSSNLIDLPLFNLHIFLYYIGSILIQIQFNI